MTLLQVVGAYDKKMEEEKAKEAREAQVQSKSDPSSKPRPSRTT